MTAHTIGNVAREAGVGIETIRFYEREGLIGKPPRTPSGYRQYPDDVIERIRFIQRAKGLGFSLADERPIRLGMRGCAPPCRGEDRRHRSEDP
jgi:MerR family copper efflux transcriptional regulator